ncbi:MAG: DUF1553 domain-containing protein [Pirellulaceae bacterium]|nr:DUF1553 domain-containing protein [Pirellulaceae bacterium]
MLATTCNRRLAFLAACALSAAVFAELPKEASGDDAKAVEFFEKNVRPVLVDECIDCHSGDEAESKLQLDSLAGMLAGGIRGPALVPGKPEKSLLIRAVRHGELVKMPPKRKLSNAEISALAKWVLDGAVWPEAKAAPTRRPTAAGRRAYTEAERSFWAFQPIRRPPPPTVKNTPWIRTPVDAFILRRLENAKASPAGRADKRDLIRRIYFGLIGLPPTPAEVESFVGDESPLALVRVVDRLLASPQYGERWGRHWLDVARYADSNGMDENLAHANAFRYRDYVVRAFNADLPYDQFVREQIAGDLAEPSADRPFDALIATGFLTLGPKMLAEDDPVKMEMDIIDEQLETLGRALLGMTFGCARCHDHKYDPFSQADYYALAGVFKSTHTMDTHTVVAKWHERPLASPAAVAKQEAHQQQLADKKEQIRVADEAAAKRVATAARLHLGDYLLAAERRRQLELIKADAKPRGGEAAADKADLFLIEAEKFARGNVGVHTTGYGEGIGVLVNIGKTPNFVEYEIEAPAAGIYQFDVRLAAETARPCALAINGKVVQSDFAKSVTGSWYPPTQKWELAGFHALTRGKNIVRVEHPTFFPHIDKLCISASKQTLLAKLQLDKAYEPLIGYVEQLSESLGKLPETSPLAEWNAAAAAGAPADKLVELARRLQSMAADGDDSTAAFRTWLARADGPFRRHAATADGFSPAEQKTLAQLRKEEKSLQANQPKLPTAMAVKDGDSIGDLKLHYRGSHLTLGPTVPRAFPRIISKQSPPIENGSGRQELAAWIGGNDNPLTARVFVNRVWRWHFGAGLVRTPDNFGLLGDRPTHPELLDYLAAEFVDSGWSIKHLQRLIVLSATYQQAVKVARADGGWETFEDDPENLLWSRMNRRRLEAEAIRDAILAVTASLDPKMEGATLPNANRSYVTSTANVNPNIYRIDRRSIYLPVVRSALYEVLQAFDFADPSTSQGGRQSTTIAPQALFMLNSEFVAQKTLAWAERLLANEQLDDIGRVRSIYETALSRTPSSRELEQATQYVRRFQASWQATHESDDDAAARAWQSLARVVISTNEFIFIE